VRSTYTISVAVTLPVAALAARRHSPVCSHALVHSWSSLHASAHGFLTSSWNLFLESGIRKCCALWECQVWPRCTPAVKAQLEHIPGHGRALPVVWTLVEACPPPLPSRTCGEPPLMLRSCGRINDGCRGNASQERTNLAVLGGMIRRVGSALRRHAALQRFSSADVLERLLCCC
jgi:hypothetical protein